MAKFLFTRQLMCRAVFVILYCGLGVRTNGEELYQVARQWLQLHCGSEGGRMNYYN
jgi:hypothetical protein